MVGMRPPIIVRELSDEEQERLEAGLHSQDLYEVRRCQILLAGDRGGGGPHIAEMLGCTDQTGRDVVRGFEQAGLPAGLARGTSPAPTPPPKGGGGAGPQPP